MTVTYQWRGAFTNAEVNALHAEAFETAVFDESEWDWAELVHRHSLGWVVARDGADEADLAGFVNVLWDGLVSRRQQGARLFTHLSPSSLEEGLQADLAVLGQVFTDVFVAAGTG